MFIRVNSVATGAIPFSGEERRSPRTSAKLMAIEVAAMTPMALPGESKDATVPARSAPIACQTIRPWPYSPMTWPWIASPV